MSRLALLQEFHDRVRIARAVDQRAGLGGYIAARIEDIEAEATGLFVAALAVPWFACSLAWGFLRLVTAPIGYALNPYWQAWRLRHHGRLWELLQRRVEQRERRGDG